MQKIHKLLFYLKEQGIAKTSQLVFDKVYPPKLPNHQHYLTLFNGLAGIEIGGPSSFFQKTLPIYQVVASLDCVNFSSETIWQGNLKEGNNYNYYQKKTGYLYICDAVSMDVIPSKKYAFCLSCNVLEHIANPLKAVSAWLRVIKDNGLLLIVVPKKESNFDHNRPITSFEHLKNDYDNHIGEDDLSHLEEILQLHDLSLDPQAGSYAEFKARSMNNFQNRAFHQHVFDLYLLSKIFQHFNLDILENAMTKTDYIILGKKC